MGNMLYSSYAQCNKVASTDVSYLILLGYLRLGCMARDKGQIYEASDWFKEALQINQVCLGSYFFCVFVELLSQ